MTDRSESCARPKLKIARDRWRRFQPGERQSNKKNGTTAGEEQIEKNSRGRRVRESALKWDTCRPRRETPGAVRFVFVTGSASDFCRTSGETDRWRSGANSFLNKRLFHTRTHKETTKSAARRLSIGRWRCVGSVEYEKNHSRRSLRCARLAWAFRALEQRPGFC